MDWLFSNDKEGQAKEKATTAPEGPSSNSSNVNVNDDAKKITTSSPSKSRGALLGSLRSSSFSFSSSGGGKKLGEVKEQDEVVATTDLIATATRRQQRQQQPRQQRSSSSSSIKLDQAINGFLGALQSDLEVK